MKPIFCIVGKTGAGKSTILNYITSEFDTRFVDINIKKIIYHTTREIREGEVDGVDYHFVPSVDSEEFKLVYNPDKIIEERNYHKYDGLVKYYTTYDDINQSDGKVLICATSVDQAITYYNKLNNVYIICIDAPLHERIKRVIDRGNQSDSECMELCRRILEESNEFDRINFFDDNDVYTVHNSNHYKSNFENKEEYSEEFDKMITGIYEFIVSKI